MNRGNEIEEGRGGRKMGEKGREKGNKGKQPLKDFFIMKHILQVG